MRKTKIICTLGPATDKEEIMREMILSGMNVARFNFSHGTHESHKNTFDMLTRLRESLNCPVATLLDTKGPEIRLGKIAGGKAELVRGQNFVLTPEEMEGTSERATISYKQLANDVVPSSRILIDDGLIELKVRGVEDNGDIFCTVSNGGFISNNKGINVPGVHLSLPFVSPKDESDILFGVRTGFDFIAASFTRSADDILEIRRILDREGCHWIKIIAKIENIDGVRNIDEILRVSDGIMVARGDMGVEIPLEEVPVLQKKLIKKGYNAGKPVITATQMLDSMIKNPRPTRAETNDVANAIYDGTSAIMLSGETAAGAFPVEALRTMSRIAERTEKDIDYAHQFKGREVSEAFDVTNAIAHATVTTATDLGAAAIITVTKSGQTARLMSKFRPGAPIISCTPNPVVCRQTSLSWGVIPLTMEEMASTDELFEHSVEAAVKAGLVQSGDLVVITAGLPVNVSGTTNLLKVHIVGDVLVTGHGINSNTACANLCVCKDEEEALRKCKRGDILVIPKTSNNLLPILKTVSGIVTEEPGENSHAAVVGLALDIPVLVGAVNACSILRSGVTVILDAARGMISCSKNCTICEDK